MRESGRQPRAISACTDSPNESQRRRERKRLSDRLSQRTARQRNKDRIASLEMEVKTLLTRNSNNALQEKIQETQALREEILRLQQLVRHIGNLCTMNLRLEAYQESDKSCEKETAPELQRSADDVPRIDTTTEQEYLQAPGFIAMEDLSQHATDLSSVLETRSSPTLAWTPLWPLPTAKTDAVGLFEGWLQEVLFLYGRWQSDQLDDLLPASPCLGALLSPSGCRYRLSKELGGILHTRHPNTDLINLTAAYWCLHMLLRYYLLPREDQLSQIPSNMRPIAMQRQFTITWAHFLPWPHLRQALLTESSNLLTTEFETAISKSIHIYWPFEVDAAIQQRGLGATQEPGSCNCTHGYLTDSFKSHISQAHNWRVRPVVPSLIAKFPALDIVTY